MLRWREAVFMPALARGNGFGHGCVWGSAVVWVQLGYMVIPDDLYDYPRIWRVRRVWPGLIADMPAAAARYRSDVCGLRWRTVRICN